MKTKKKKASKKKAPKKSMEQRRYEHEVAHRETVLQKLADRIAKFNEDQPKRDAYLARVAAICEKQRNHLQSLVHAELKRQAAVLKKHPDALGKMKIGIKLPGKLAAINLPTISPRLNDPLSVIPPKGGKIKKKVKKAGKPARKTDAAEESTGSGEG